MLYFSLCYVEFFLCHVLHQCVTVRQRTARCPFVDYSAVYYFCAFFPYFTVAIYIFSCCTFFIMHHFHVALFCVAIISCYTFFMYCTISCCTFTRCKVFVLHSSPVVLIVCCSFFFFHVTLFPEVQPGPPQTFKMESFATIINKAVKYCQKLCIFDVCGCPGYASTISMLHFFDIEKY